MPGSPFSGGQFGGTQFGGSTGPAAPIYTPPPLQRPSTAPPQIFTNVPTLLQANYVRVIIYYNGLQMTEGLDFTRDGGFVTLLLPPQPGDVVTAAVFARGKALGGPTPERFIAPWSIQLAGRYDGEATLYQIDTGPTIFGALNGTNKLFSVACQLSRMQVWRNGLLQTLGLDCSCGSTAVVFRPASIPQPGDTITIFGW